MPTIDGQTFPAHVHREYPKWVSGKLVRSAEEEAEALGASERSEAGPEVQAPEPVFSQEEFGTVTADAERDLMESLDVTPRAPVEVDNLMTEDAVLQAPAPDPLDHDGNGRRGGSKRRQKLHLPPKG